MIFHWQSSGLRSMPGSDDRQKERKRGLAAVDAWKRCNNQVCLSNHRAVIRVLVVYISLIVRSCSTSRPCPALADWLYNDWQTLSCAKGHPAALYEPRLGVLEACGIVSLTMYTNDDGRINGGRVNWLFSTNNKPSCRRFFLMCLQPIKEY